MSKSVIFFRSDCERLKPENESVKRKRSSDNFRHRKVTFSVRSAKFVLISGKIKADFFRNNQDVKFISGLNSKIQE
jgi:hypothetical protein